MTSPARCPICNVELPPSNICPADHEPEEPYTPWTLADDSEGPDDVGDDHWYDFDGRPV